MTEGHGGGNDEGHGEAHVHDHEDHTGHHHRPLSFTDEVNEFRSQKDEFFRSSHGSPIPHDVRHTFSGLRYFAPDEAYRLEGVTLDPDPDPANTAEIVTSDGKTRIAARVGTLAFATPTGSGELSGYSFDTDGDADGELFVPFRDGSSGQETYGAGRYLDVERDDDGTYVLDFNLAYNPWCAYAPQYSCPLPPRENWLPFRVEAGEQNPELEAAGVAAAPDGAIV